MKQSDRSAYRAFLNDCSNPIEKETMLDIHPPDSYIEASYSIKTNLEDYIEHGPIWAPKSDEPLEHKWGTYWPSSDVRARARSDAWVDNHIRLNAFADK